MPGRASRQRARGGRRLLPAGLFAAGLAIAGVSLIGTSAAAATGQVSAQYQGYGDAAPGGQDPYANDNPQDIHVDGFGGQPVVTGYLLLNLDSLPSGSTINGLQLHLVPNDSQSDNVEPGLAAIEACGLTQPLASNGYQATPPAYDCSVHAAGEPQVDGSWNFELFALAQRWEQGANDGLALVAYPAPTGTPVTQASPAAWSVAFDHTKSVAAVDYSAATSSPFGGGAPAPAPGPISASGGAAVTALPPVNPAPAAPAAATPNPSVSAPAPGAVGRQPAAEVPLRAGGQWLWIAGALVGAALLMVVVTAAQQVLSGGSINLLGRTGAALAASRSQLATPVAVLALASVFALGFSGQLAGSAGSAVNASGGGGTGSGGGPSAAGSSAAGGAAGGGALGGPGGSGIAGGASGNGVSAAEAAANTNGGLDGPGVTATTVRIGFVYVTNTQSANQAFGVHVPDPGNEQAEEAALVAYVNKHGGIAGRQILPVYVGVNNAQAETDATSSEETCRTMTEDYHVFAVIAGGGAPDADSANACYAEAGTMNFEPSFAEPDLTFLRQASPYIWPTEPAALDRMMRWEVAGLASRGYFSNNPAYKLGVVVAEDAVNARVYNQVTLPALEAAGVNPSNIDEEQVPHDTIDDIANSMKQVVAKYQVEQVTNVFFQGGGNYGQGSYALLFMLDAESQHYNPRYGLSSDDGPIALTTNVPQDQFANALVVGTMPGADTDDAHYQPWPYSSSEKLCASIMAGSGNTFSSREGALAILAYCDAVFELQDGARSLVGQPLNAQLWANAAMSLGSNYFNAALYSRFIGPNHWDAAGGYRLLHAVVPGCNGCNAYFVYDNATVYS